MSHLRSSALSDLNGRVAVVTGGGTGVGLMIATGLAVNGAKVYITGRRAAILDKAAQSPIEGAQHKLIPIVTDVTDHASIKNAVRVVEKNDGKLDILVNNAGVSGFQSSIQDFATSAQKGNVPTDTIDNWAEIYKTNVAAAYFITDAFAPLLAKGAAGTETASVINVTSMAGVAHVPMGMPGYVVSKGAAEHLTKVQATDFALRGLPIRVNSIALGPYQTDMTGDSSFIDGMVNAAKPGQIGAHTTPRVGKAEEVAGTVLYLASAAGRYTNGTTIAADGGYSVLNP